MAAPLLDLLTRIAEGVERLGASSGPRGCGRPLAADNLVSAQEVARELGCRDAAARELLSSVPPVVTPGQARRWRWGDVLQALTDRGAEPAAKPARRRRQGALLHLPTPADV